MILLPYLEWAASVTKTRGPSAAWCCGKQARMTAAPSHQEQAPKQADSMPSRNSLTSANDLHSVGAWVHCNNMHSFIGAAYIAYVRGLDKRDRGLTYLRRYPLERPAMTLQQIGLVGPVCF